MSFSRKRIHPTIIIIQTESFFENRNQKQRKTEKFSHTSHCVPCLSTCDFSLIFLFSYRTLKTILVFRNEPKHFRSSTCARLFWKETNDVMYSGIWLYRWDTRSILPYVFPYQLTTLDSTHSLWLIVSLPSFLFCLPVFSV